MMPLLSPKYVYSNWLLMGYLTLKSQLTSSYYSVLFISLIKQDFNCDSSHASFYQAVAANNKIFAASSVVVS